MEFEITFDREEDGRWIAEIEALPGVLAYGATRIEAQSRVEALALRVIADRIEEQQSTAGSVRFEAA
jgi:predicted RNase H-like HicB family nuclease